MSADPVRDSRWPVRRSAARLAAIQALYQIDQSDESADAVMEEFRRYRFDGSSGAEPDPALFADVVHGVERQRDELDGKIATFLSKPWSIGRLALVLRSILRAGIYELGSRRGTPAKVVVTEYVDLAHAFFSGSEPGLVNAVLDRAARTLRPVEFETCEDEAETVAGC